jgi:hypothetical protein
MPLHVTIDINSSFLSAVHIGRVKGGTDSDSVNEYLAVRGEQPQTAEDWLTQGVLFTHRYGDGAEVCVMKALQALHEADEVSAGDVK